MQKLFLPILCSPEGVVAGDMGANIYAPEDGYFAGFYNMEAAKDFAKILAARSPGSKVVILESTLLIEPRRIEFSEKTYNANGEVVV